MSLYRLLEHLLPPVRAAARNCSSRQSTTASCRRSLHCLAQDNKKLVRLAGADVSSFLQGLITNDMQHLVEGAPSMYAMVLNTQGRVLHDIFIYNNSSATATQKQEDYLIEVDAGGADQLEKHLKMYRLRKKIDISLCSEMKCWVLFEPGIDFDSISKVDIECLYINPKVDSKHELKLIKEPEGVLLSRDPRMIYLGHKLILPENLTPADLITDLAASDDSSYTTLRHRLGVGEGPAELPPGDVMPLEANVDYLHGISFHKGCYVGQELTARVFHTGVVRKRYMPVVLATGADLPPESNVVNSKGRRVGRIRAMSGQHGLALLKVADCLADLDGLSVEGQSLSTFKPAWWPIEAAKQTPSTS